MSEQSLCPNYIVLRYFNSLNGISNDFFAVMVILLQRYFQFELPKTKRHSVWLNSFAKMRYGFLSKLSGLVTNEKNRQYILRSLLQPIGQTEACPEPCQTSTIKRLAKKQLLTTISKISTFRTFDKVLNSPLSHHHLALCSK